MRKFSIGDMKAFLLSRGLIDKDLAIVPALRSKNSPKNLVVSQKTLTFVDIIKYRSYGTVNITGR